MKNGSIPGWRIDELLGHGVSLPLTDKGSTGFQTVEQWHGALVQCVRLCINEYDGMCIVEPC